MHHPGTRFCFQPNRQSVAARQLLDEQLECSQSQAEGRLNHLKVAMVGQNAFSDATSTSPGSSWLACFRRETSRARVWSPVNVDIMSVGQKRTKVGPSDPEKWRQRSGCGTAGGSGSHVSFGPSPR